MSTDENLDRNSEDLNVRARAFRELAHSFERDGAHLLAERALARAQEIERRLWNGASAATARSAAATPRSVEVSSESA